MIFLLKSNPPQAYIANLWVSELMLPNSKKRDHHVVHFLYDDAIANINTNTPLFAYVTKDKKVWKPYKNGLYSVQRAYLLGVNKAIYISHLKVKGRWDLILKIRAPPKVKKSDVAFLS